MSILAGIEIPANSRFSIHENVNVAPGVCVVCRSAGGDGRHFVDFGFQMDYYGAVFFCSECVRELAEAIGFVPAAAMNVIKEMNKTILEELKKVQGEFDDFRNASAIVLRNCTCSLSGRSNDGIDGAVKNLGEKPGSAGGTTKASGKVDKASGS